MFFSALNYKLLGIAVLLIVGGFAAMYMENEINGFISLLRFTYSCHGGLCVGHICNSKA